MSVLEPRPSRPRRTEEGSEAAYAAQLSEWCGRGLFAGHSRPDRFIECLDGSGIFTELKAQARYSRAKYRGPHDGHGMSRLQFENLLALDRATGPDCRVLLLIDESESAYPLDPEPPGPADFCQWLDVLAEIDPYETRGSRPRLVWPMWAFSRAQHPTSAHVELPSVSLGVLGQMDLAF